MRSTILMLSMLLVTSVSVIGCNDASQPEKNVNRENGNGTIVLKAQWPAEHSPSSPNQAYTLFDCTEMNVAKISACVFSDAGEPIKEAGPWDCAQRNGTIEDVPVGDNHLVRLTALDPHGDVVYRGEAPDIGVQPNQTVQVKVFMEDVFSRALSMAQDINPGIDGSFPHRLVEFQNQLYMVALAPDVGFELYNADSAQFMRDIYPTGVPDRTGVASPTNFVELNDWLYFFADNGNGYRLWRTNGTAAATEPASVSDDYVNPTELTVMQDKLFFAADSVEVGRELWVYEESTGQVKLFHDIYQGQGSSNPHELTVSGNVLFFVADDGKQGDEIWQTNSQAAQCTIVHDISVGATGSDPRHLTDVNGRLFFVAKDGPQKLADGDTPATHYYEPWMTLKNADGLTATLVDDLNDTTVFNGTSKARNLTWVHGSTLAFSAYTPDTGQSLYLYDWENDDAPRRIESSYPDNFAYLDGTLYYTAYSSDGVEHLWAGPLDGSQLPQCLTKSVPYPVPRNITVVNQTIYFTASHDFLGRRLWATDGTKTGLVVGTDGENAPHSPSNLFAASEDRLYYSAFRAEDGEELFQLIDH